MDNSKELVIKGYYAWIRENNLKDNDENTSKFVELWRQYGYDKQ